MARPDRSANGTPVVSSLDRLLAATAGLAATIADTEALLQRRADILADPMVVRGQTSPRRFDLVPLSEAAKRTGRHPEVLRRWCAEGRIDGVRIGRTWWLHTETVAELAQHARRARPRLPSRSIAQDGVKTSTPNPPSAVSSGRPTSR